jgi:fructokinase
MNAWDTYRERPRLTSWGELLWDVYPDGPRLGGAPANLAFHARRLGAEARLITRVGHDELGNRALAELSEKGIVVESGARSAWPTGQVQVGLSQGEPSYTIVAPAAYDEIEPSFQAQAALQGSDFFCFGTLALRHPDSSQKLQTLLKLAKGGGASPTRVVDLNLRPPHSSKTSALFCLEHADILKLNQNEFSELERWLDVADLRSALFRRFALKLVLVTRGAEGATLHTPGLSVRQAGVASKARDKVGAGDAFLAAFLVNFAAQVELAVSLQRAAHYAARVADEAGAMPELPIDFRRACTPYSLDDLAQPERP